MLNIYHNPVHFNKFGGSADYVQMPLFMVTGTRVPVICYRSFWFATGTSHVCYRNMALNEGYVTETSHATVSLRRE